MNRLIAALALLSVGVASPQARLASAQGLADHLTVTQWVRPAVRSKFRALVVAPTVGGMQAVQDARVTLLSGSGEVFSGVSDSSGNVEVLGVQPGVYALLVQADQLSACYAMHVTGAEHVKPGVLAETAVIPCAAIPLSTLRETVMPYLGNRYERSQLSLNEVDVQSLVDQIRGNERFRFNQREGGFEGHLYAASKRDTGVMDRLDPAELQNVFLFQDGEQLGRDITDSDGRFSFANIEPGVYSLVTVGPHGIAAIGFELQAESDWRADLHSSDGRRFVMAGGDDNGLALQPIAVDGDELGMEPADTDVEVADVVYTPPGLLTQQPTSNFQSGSGGPGGAVGDPAGLALLGLLGAAASGSTGGFPPAIASPVVPVPLRGIEPGPEPEIEP